MKSRLYTALAAMSVMAATTFISCDTPQSIAWTHYSLAEDKLNEGKIEEAKEWLLKVQKNRDSVLDAKVDSLSAVIDQLLAEANDSI